MLGVAGRVRAGLSERGRTAGRCRRCLRADGGSRLGLLRRGRLAGSAHPVAASAADRWLFSHQRLLRAARRAGRLRPMARAGQPRMELRRGLAVLPAVGVRSGLRGRVARERRSDPDPPPPGRRTQPGPAGVHRRRGPGRARLRRGPQPTGRPRRRTDTTQRPRRPADEHRRHLPRRRPAPAESHHPLRRDDRLGGDRARSSARPANPAESSASSPG